MKSARVAAPNHTAPTLSSTVNELAPETETGAPGFC